MIDSLLTLVAPMPKEGKTMDRTDVSLIALRRILRATELYGKELASAAGLSAPQLRVLQIAGEEGSATPSIIATRMGVSQATITTLVDKLVAKGLVTREPSQRDRRQTNVTVTRQGQVVLDDAPDALQQRYVRKFESLEDWEQAQIIASLERVAAMLDADDIDAAPVLHHGDLKTHKH